MKKKKCVHQWALLAPSTKSCFATEIDGKKGFVAAVQTTIPAEVFCVHCLEIKTLKQ